jgi:lambda repressor-like predicted transcriptional regulator
MNADEIRKAVRDKGFYLSDIARALEVTPTTVSQVVSGQAKSRKIAKAIGNITGFSLEQLWPGQYPDSYQRARRDCIEERMHRVTAAIRSHAA